MRKARSFALACATCAALTALGGCATSGSGVAQAGGTPGTSTPHRNPNVITQEELEASGETSTLAAIQRLRPAFLQTRGASRIIGPDEGITVYIDGAKFGNTTSLGNIPIEDIKRIEFLNAGEATQRFGTGNTHGALLITRK